MLLVHGSIRMSEHRSVGTQGSHPNHVFISISDTYRCIFVKLPSRNIRVLYTYILEASYPWQDCHKSNEQNDRRTDKSRFGHVCCYRSLASRVLGWTQLISEPFVRHDGQTFTRPKGIIDISTRGEKRNCRRDTKKQTRDFISDWEGRFRKSGEICFFGCGITILTIS